MKNLKISQPRQIIKLPDLEYRMIDAVCSTDLKMFSESPRNYQLYKEGKTPTSDAMHFGTMAHMAILEPEKFLDTYIVEPDRCVIAGVEYLAGNGPKETHIHRNRKEWKDFIGEWSLKNSTKIQLSPDEFNVLRKMMNAVNMNPTAAELIRTHEKEMVALWQDPATGMKCKAKADLVGTHLIDIKSVDFKGDEASPRNFERLAYKRGYHVQSAFYDQGFQISGCNFSKRFIIAVEKSDKKSEVNCLVMEISRELLERGYEINKRLMEKFHECRNKNYWPGFTGTYLMQIPSWAVVDVEENGNGTE